MKKSLISPTDDQLSANFKLISEVFRTQYGDLSSYLHHYRQYHSQLQMEHQHDDNLYVEGMHEDQLISHFHAQLSVHNQYSQEQPKSQSTTTDSTDEGNSPNRSSSRNNMTSGDALDMVNSSTENSVKNDNVGSHSIGHNNSTPTGALNYQSMKDHPLSVEARLLLIAAASEVCLVILLQLY